MTFALKNNDGQYLTIDDTWIDLLEGLKADSIRGYTEAFEVFEESKKIGANVVPHPWPTGEQRELFPLWAELGPEGTMKGDK